MDEDACMWGLWRLNLDGERRSKGCVFDCNYSRALSPPRESEGGRRGRGLDWGQGGMRVMGEVEFKHVSICCRDGGNLQKEFSPWPILPLKPEDVVQGWTEWWRPTRRHRGIMEEASRLPDSGCQKNKSEIKLIWALTKIWHPNQPPLGCMLLGADGVTLQFFFSPHTNGNGKKYFDTSGAEAANKVGTY